MSHELSLSVFAAFLAVGGLVWKLASLTTELSAAVLSLKKDIQRIEPRLVQLDDLAVIKRDIAAVVGIQGAQGSILAKHHSDISELRVNLAVHDGAAAERQSQGDYR